MITALRALKLGDLLVAVPALRALSAHWPDKPLALATTFWLEPLSDLIGCVDEFVPLTGLEPLPRSRTDVAVNLHGAGPESNDILDALRPRVRIGHLDHGWPGPHWRDDLHERDRWCRMLSAFDIPADPADMYLAPPEEPSEHEGCVIVHPGAAYGSKRWPAERFAAVVAELARDHRVVLTGTAKEYDLVSRVADMSGARPTVLAGGTDLVGMATLIAGARLLVTNDTGAAHLAYAYRTPTVVLFGPVGPEQWGPPAGDRHRALTAAHLRRGEPFVADPDPALLGVSVAEVLTASQDLLEPVPSPLR